MRQLRPEALGSIPSGDPSIFLSVWLIYHQLFYQQFLPPVISIVTKEKKHGGGCEVEQRASLVEQAQQKAHQSTQEAGSCMVLQ